MALVLCYLICLFLYNLRYMKFVNTDKKKKWKLRDLYGLMVAGTPLFINSFLMMSITNSPKMVIDKYTELGVIDNGVQTIFGIIFFASLLSEFGIYSIPPSDNKDGNCMDRREKKIFYQNNSQYFYYLCLQSLLDF